MCRECRHKFDTNTCHRKPAESLLAWFTGGKDKAQAQEGVQQPEESLVDRLLGTDSVDCPSAASRRGSAAVR